MFLKNSGFSGEVINKTYRFCSGEDPEETLFENDWPGACLKNFEKNP